MLVLYANGVAVRSSVMKAHTNDDTYYAEGFATVDAVNFASIGARQSGRWSEKGGKVSIAWTIGGTQELTRNGDKLTEQYSSWAPYAPVDGLRLDGRFSHAQGFGPPMMLTLRKDGTFTEDGVNDTMGGTMVNLDFPVHGSGTYEIARWSLVLRFSNGFVQSINLLLGGGDPTSTTTMVLNGYDFARG